MLAAPTRAFDRERGVDQADMGEALREIAQRRAAVGIDLLAEQAEIAGVAEQVFEEPFGLIEIAAAREVVDRPEAADAEGAFVRTTLAATVAIEQPVRAKPV